MVQLKESKLNSSKVKELSLQELGLQFFNSRSERDFTKIYNRLKPSISYFLREMLPNQDDRNEVIATTFSKIWAKIHQYDPYWNFSTWAYRIARNEALLFFRSKKKTFSYEGMEEMGINMDSKVKHDDAEVYESVEEDPICLLHDLTVAEIKNLPGVYQQVLTLRELENMKYEDISATLGWKTNTVRTRIRKARSIVLENITKKEPALVKFYNQEENV